MQGPMACLTGQAKDTVLTFDSVLCDQANAPGFSWYQAASSVWPCPEPLTMRCPGMSMRAGADCFCLVAHAGDSIFLTLAKLGDTLHGNFSAC